MADTTTFEIPAHRIAVFRERFDALVRRAKRLKCEPPTCEIGPLTEREVREYDALTGETVVEIVEFHPVTVAGKAPRFEGWRFVAVIDYEEHAAIIRQCAPGDDLAPRYRTLGPLCEHCKADRQRKQVFVVHHDGGRELQVGRQCIRDFLGHRSPEQIASAAELVAELHAVGSRDPDDDLALAPRQPCITDYLAHVARAVRLWGWRSRASVVADEEMATADLAWAAWENECRARKLGASRHSLVGPTKDDRNRAVAVLEWARALPAEGASDYQHNLRAACSLGGVRLKNAGIVASAVSAYDREQAAGRPLKSEHVGQIGERLRDVLVRVVSTRELEPNEYGEREIVKVRDGEGRTLVWFTKPRSIRVGEEHFLTGTVVKHSEFRGLKETRVSRCELREIDAPTPAEVRAAGKLASGLYALREHLCHAPLRWKGWGDFEGRVREAERECDLVSLAALRDEMHALAPALMPPDDPKDTEELRAVSEKITVIRELTQPPRPKRAPVAPKQPVVPKSAAPSESGPSRPVTPQPVVAKPPAPGAPEPRRRAEQLAFGF